MVFNFHKNSMIFFIQICRQTVISMFYISIACGYSDYIRFLWISNIFIEYLSDIEFYCDIYFVFSLPNNQQTQVNNR